MSHRADKTAVRRVPRALRIVIPAVLILVWLAAAAVGGPYFGKVDEVSSNEQSAYLPTSAEATEVQNRLGDFSDSDALPAIAVFVGDDELTKSDLAALKDALASAGDIPHVQDASPPIPSDDGHAAEAFVPIDADAEVGDVVADVRDTLTDDLPDGITMHITGPAGFTGDLLEAFAGIDGLLLGVALLAVFIILVLVYRSFLLPVAVLATSLFALCAALLTVWWLAKADVLMLSGQIQGILFILVIGAATDYSLLYVSRYREQLRVTSDKGQATTAALKGSVEPIVASGGTVIVGLLCLMFSDLKSNSALGPVASIGIVFAIAAALSLLPSILFAFGRAAFWPRRPRFEPETVAAEHGMPARGVWPRVAGVIKRHHRAVWIVTVIVLAAAATGITQLHASGVAQSDLVLGQSDARDGQQALGEHFPGGSGSPTYAIVSQPDLQRAADVMLDSDGISGVQVATSDAASGTASVTADGIRSHGESTPEPTVSGGDVLLEATLTDAADSDAAETTVRQLRTDLQTEVGDDAIVGGVTAVAIDTNDASIHDRNLIIPVILIVILVILMLLLRSIVAPLILIGTTVLSFGTAMGVSALVFNHVFDFPGADAAVPLYGFVFLVALGIDYNIFLMTRVREEALAHGPREGVLRGLAITGGVITSAGVVLASTFAALSVIPVLFLVQLAFIVAFGVLLDTIVVRSLLVPALVYDLGRAAWWPSRLSKPARSTPYPEKEIRSSKN